jgi:DNA-binding NtrC family response regulator
MKSLILLVDDDPSVRESLAQTLERALDVTGERGDAALSGRARRDRITGFDVRRFGGSLAGMTTRSSKARRR